MMIGAEKLLKAMACITRERQQDFQTVLPLIENTILMFVGESQYDYLNVICATFVKCIESI